MYDPPCSFVKHLQNFSDISLDCQLTAEDACMCNCRHLGEPYTLLLKICQSLGSRYAPARHMWLFQSMPCWCCRACNVAVSEHAMLLRQSMQCCCFSACNVAVSGHTMWLFLSVSCCCFTACLSGNGDCRRTLDSPDFQLLVHFDELCPCGSRVQRASCCYSTCEAGQGGVLWPQFHCCGCDNAVDTFINPNVCCLNCVRGLLLY